MSPIVCPLCSAWRPGPTGAIAWVRCRDCGAMLFRASDGPPVMVAHESEELSQQIGVVLLDAGFAPIRVPDGRRALGVFDSRKPAAAVIDVALDDVMCFQILDHLRRTPDLENTKVVLVASVFRKTAYKRRPETLYGADDYVEQHHIPDKLPQKLCQLLGLPAPDLDAVRQGQVERIREGEGRTDLTGTARAHALAHGIVADIALYHEAEVHAASVNGDLGALSGVLDEGRRMLEERLNADELPPGDPILEAFQALLDDMRRAAK